MYFRYVQYIPAENSPIQVELGRNVSGTQELIIHGFPMGIFWGVKSLSLIPR
jgi:hypothetical protein